jgi:hypothetical protein
MKYFTLLAICCVIAFSPSLSQVDSIKSIESVVTFPVDSSKLKMFEFSLTGGISKPYLPKNFHDYWKGGWNAGAGVGMTFAPGSVGYGSILLNFNMSRFAFDYLKYRNLFLQADQTISRKPAWMVDIMFNFRGTVTALSKFIQPYVSFGIGYLHFYQGDILVGGYAPDTVLGETKSAIAWDFGVGIDVPVTNNFGIFFDGTSVLGVTDPTRQYFPLRGGLRYRFAK